MINLINSPGTVTSPDADRNGLYDLNIDLLWIIEAPEGQIIRYQLQSALIRNSVNCYRDGLKVGIRGMVRKYQENCRTFLQSII